ncbi:MAG: glycoside hydrolase family 15 protein [Calothrix sp. MO_192.B10]|nr:glycoside hydrolase family 15 protein [Calothrix sp. MO_192.B10]
MLVIHQEKLLEIIKYRFTNCDILKLSAFLNDRKTFIFPTLDNGLFPAAAVSTDTEYIGYANVWLRDNIFLAYSHYVVGQLEVALKNVNSLMAYFKKYQWRFEGIIEGRLNPDNFMERPHIRFDGHNLEEIEQDWNHAQNDALGYFLWFYCKLAREGFLNPQPAELEILALFPFYFQAISYWQDEDSGHWEEDRKIEASSIGVVIAGLKSLKQLLTDTRLASHCKYKDKSVSTQLLDELIDTGTVSLNNILPSECIQPEPQKRRYDAALLFLIYPLQIIEGEMADQILVDVVENLQGDYGICRYLGDSFWCRDYKDIPEEIRTSISSEREEWFKDNGRELRVGEEAQWCIFDPIVSAIWGMKFQKTRQQEYLEQQTHYLNRALGQLTGKDSPFEEFKCPELYYLQNGKYIPNDATPLLWTQANLRIALKMMEQSLSF